MPERSEGSASAESCCRSQPAALLALAVAESSHPSGRTCGLDPGRVRVGLALEDELGLLAHPRGWLDARDSMALARELCRLVEEEHVTRFVVGLPLDMSGAEGKAAREARAFAERVGEWTQLPVELWDERLTTVQAQRALSEAGLRMRKARGRIDAAAACAILQSWMDARQGR
jgi:putative holliday junction resolvase